METLYPAVLAAVYLAYFDVDFGRNIGGALCVLSNFDLRDLREMRPELAFEKRGPDDGNGVAPGIIFGAKLRLD